MPESIHEVIAQLASRLARWDDRLFRKSIFGVADEVELKFMDRRSHENLHLLGIILNQEIRRLSTQVLLIESLSWLPEEYISRTTLQLVLKKDGKRSRGEEHGSNSLFSANRMLRVFHSLCFINSV
ncbi:uncharacterized protein [Euphorbia lathyris]|uniref:uncharacterized protein n=1 Tax=Euphorbia lathyris TaxID=212925 RepID=UPI00331329AD